MVQTARQAPASVPCIVLRPVYLDGARQDIGTRLDLPAAIYAQCHASGKVGPAPMAAPAQRSTARAKTPADAAPTEAI